jgi:hypothetical protein
MSNLKFGTRKDFFKMFNMRRVKIISLVIIIIALIFLFASCEKGEGPIKGKGPQFLIASPGNASTGIKPGLYLMSPGKTEANISFVTGYYPWAFQQRTFDLKNGRIAFSVEKSILPAGVSGIAYMDVNDISNVQFVPLPEAPKDHNYSVPNERPWVFTDGRIAYRLILNTDNPYDDYHVGMLAIYDPKSGVTELSGDPSGFVLSQPEKGYDTEGGSMGGGFVLSPDEKYAYCQVYGYGTDWGVFHVDFKFIVQYEIGAQNGYERLAQTNDTPTAATGDGKSLILSGSGLQKIDLVTKVMTKVDDYANIFDVGQVSKNSSRMLKVWRGSGMGEFDWSKSVNPFLHIIDGLKIEDTSYKGLGHGCQYSTDESKIYFTGSTDFYTNYATPLVIYSTPKIEKNTLPDSITTIPVDYCTNVFLLLMD